MSEDTIETNVDITDPLIELLAIKLYEHSGERFPQTSASWSALQEADREVFREMARGRRPFYTIRGYGD
jgi:hypothetical protein